MRHEHMINHLCADNVGSVLELLITKLSYLIISEFTLGAKLVGAVHVHLLPVFRMAAIIMHT